MSSREQESTAEEDEFVEAFLLDRSCEALGESGLMFLTPESLRIRRNWSVNLVSRS